MRIGFGYDIHPLIRGKNLIIGGVKIESKYGLKGHSDADVVVHAVIDAILGASGQGDIGIHFPNNEIKWKGISSLVLLSHIYELVEKERFRINNIDITIILERPKLIYYYPDMKKNIAGVLKIKEDQINIKATTNEGIGFIGKGEGIAATCVALLEKHI